MSTARNKPLYNFQAVKFDNVKRPHSLVAVAKSLSTGLIYAIIDDSDSTAHFRVGRVEFAKDGRKNVVLLETVSMFDNYSTAVIDLASRLTDGCRT